MQRVRELPLLHALCEGGRNLWRLQMTDPQGAKVSAPEVELAVQFLFSGGAILDRLHLLCGFVSLLWRDQVPVIRDCTAPLALTANDKAAASTLLGRSAMITKSSLPKA